jgi:Rieske Fe-S protein
LHFDVWSIHPLEVSIMASHATDLRRRRFLTAAIAWVGGVGMVATSLPFVKSMLPSAAAKAAGMAVEVKWVGMLLTVE